DYPLLDGLKMPPYMGYYDGKGDPDNYLYLFEGAIRTGSLYDNYHGHNEEEETALLFAELDQLIEHVAFLNVELRESVVGVDSPVIVFDALVVPIDAPVIALKEEIQRPRKRKRDMEDESASAIVTFGRPNKSR
ncbi:hypothetical protein Tco_1171971, partial [Tanacetum coccineum]